MSARIYLIRHGETDGNASGIMQGASVDLPLNNLGHQQAQLLANRLKNIAFNFAFASALTRAKQTATYILENRDLDLTIDNAIIERAYGELEGAPVSAFKDAFLSSGLDAYYKFTPNGGETWQAVQDRAASFAQELCSLSGNILVVAHGGFNRAFLNHCHGLGIDSILNYEQHNTCVNIINPLIPNVSAFEIELYNCTEHLNYLDKS